MGMAAFPGLFPARGKEDHVFGRGVVIHSYEAADLVGRSGKIFQYNGSFSGRLIFFSRSPLHPQPPNPTVEP